MSVKCIPPHTPHLYSKTGVCYISDGVGRFGSVRSTEGVGRRKGMSSRRVNFNFISKQLFTKRNQLSLNLADRVCNVKCTIKCNLYTNFYRNHFTLPHILYFIKHITFNQSDN